MIRFSEKKIKEDLSIIKELRRLARFTTHHLYIETDRLLKEINSNLLNKIGIDPKDIEWNDFRLFDIAEDETRWTQWLGGLLRPVNGDELSNLTWRSLCYALSKLEQVKPETKWQKGRLIIGREWFLLMDMKLKDDYINDEFFISNRSRPDLLIETPDVAILIENKINCRWSTKDQPDKYREDIRQRVGKGKRIAFVLLAVDCDHVGEIPKDYFKLSYKLLAQALRIQIKSYLFTPWSKLRLIRLWPVLMTIGAIEHEFLEYDWSILSLNHKIDSVRNSQLSDLNDYLNSR